MDDSHTHLAIRVGQNSHDGRTDAAELAPPVWPAGVRGSPPRRDLDRVVTCETLEEVLEGVV
jgi:hypothetical protein